jgi:general secretion pathway protein K
MRAVMAHREKGSALILALWAMLAMAALLAGLRIFSLRAATLAGAQLERAQLLAVADGMINLTVLRLMDIAGGHPPVDGTETGLRFAGFEGRIRVQDETGRIDLNQASQSLLARAFAAAGAGAEAESLAARILDWREPGATRRLSGAKAADYRTEGYAYGPRGGKFLSVEEVRLVMGMPEAVFDAAAPLLTVASQNAYPDQAVAPDAVLRLLDGMDAARADGILSARAARLRTQADGTMVDLDPPPASGHAFSIRVDVAGRTEAVKRRAVLRLTGIPRAPLVIYSWS